MSKLKSILIRGGTVVTPETMMDADLLIRGEQIQAIGHDLPVPRGAEVVEARDLLVLPGIIDAHAHIQLDTGIYASPGNWQTESCAAAFGGVTTVVDFATQFPGQSFAEALDARLAEAAPACIDYAFHIMVTDVPPGHEDVLGDLVDLGIQSLKLYTTYRPNYYMDDAAILRLLEAAGRYGLTTLVHCENDALVTAQTQALIEAGDTGWRYHGASRPALAEQEAAARVLLLAEAARAPVVIVHNSTAKTTALVAEARARGQIAFCETCPQYLVLDNTLYAGGEPWRYILQPPLRDPQEREKLWPWVAGGEIDMIVTDHCDYTQTQKSAVDDFTQTPGGLPGLETLLPLMATYGVSDGYIAWTDIARLLAAGPAQVYNLWPRKGALLPGSDADVVLYDPTPTDAFTVERLHSAAGYTPYEGMRVQGRVISTLRRGTFLVRDGAFVGGDSAGMYLRREPLFWG
ncbi:MAG TPA: dihydropyrimidinase [Anaerolineae bacterium]|nr:dihydropyrimidinase [Anaerolineae bacterium]HQH37130.1 dihydropyrimidinase [Anaerolineae bacterium]